MNNPIHSKYRPSIDEICDNIYTALKSVHPDIHELLTAFNILFGNLEIKKEIPEFATIYYLLITIFKDTKFKNKQIPPSLHLFVAIAKNPKIFNRKYDSSRTKFENVIEEFLDKGVLARILFSKSNQNSRYYFPTNPRTLWMEINDRFSQEQKMSNEKYGDIIKKFEEKIYVPKFGLQSKLLNNNYNVINFNTKWMIYLLLTYAKGSSELSLLLSRMRKDKISFYEQLLQKKIPVKIILDLRDFENVKNAKELRERYKTHLKMKYNYKELKGTTRRIVLKNSFAIDVIKILPPSRTDAPSDSLYMGVLYSDQNISTFENIFKSWWDQATSSEEIENEVLINAVTDKKQ
jgi:hypothetical protein